MKKIKTCTVCGVPLRVGRDHLWGSDGTITLRRDPGRRMVFFDSEGLDILFANIEQLLGISVEKILIESKARSARQYVRGLLRGPLRHMARLLGTERFVGRISEQGKLLGYGMSRTLGFSWKDKEITVEVSNPYSLPCLCADIKGATEAVTGDMGVVTTEKTAPDTYSIKVSRGSYAPELTDRLISRPLPLKPGDIEYERCPGCDLPLEVSHFKWELDEGLIVHEYSGLRMALFGPQGLDVFFSELESELGEDMPRYIVEAQRMYAETRMSLRLIGARREDVRKWLAIRGLGNLVYQEAKDDVLEARIENPALALVIVGTALAFYEFTRGLKGRAQWSREEDGDLVMRFTPA